MAFHEVLFPTDISYGSIGGPGFSTTVIETDSGAEQRISRWSAARRQYNVAYGVRSHENLATLVEFYIARSGPAIGFRYKDFHDRTTTANGLSTELGGSVPTESDHFLQRESDGGTNGDGIEVNFQMIKRYDAGPFDPDIVRKLTKIVDSTDRIAVDGATQTEGVDYTADYNTGLMTFGSPPGIGLTVTGGCQFDVPVRFGLEVDKVLQMNIENFGTGSSEVIPLVELVDSGELHHDFFYGGAIEMTLIGTNALSLATARVINATGTSVFDVIRLPDPTNLPYGGPYFYIHNDGAQSFDLEYPIGVPIATVEAGETVTCIIWLNTLKQWLVF